MLMGEDVPDIPNEVINYLHEQRAREQELIKEKKVLKERIKKVQDMLKLLEGRADGLPCTVASGNIYQQCTVQQVRDNLTANLAISMEHFVTAHRKIRGIQRELNQDYEAICASASRPDEWLNDRL